MFGNARAYFDGIPIEHGVKKPSLSSVYETIGVPGAGEEYCERSFPIQIFQLENYFHVTMVSLPDCNTVDFLYNSLLPMTTPTTHLRSSPNVFLYETTDWILNRCV